MVKNAAQVLWTDVCDIYEYHGHMTENKSTRSEEVCVHENIPCRISFEMMRAARKTEAATATAMRVKLFLSKDIEIAPGSKIVVTRGGRKLAFKNSGPPSLYSAHQEILLTQYDSWT